MSRCIFNLHSAPFVKRVEISAKFIRNIDSQLRYPLSALAVMI